MSRRIAIGIVCALVGVGGGLPLSAQDTAQNTAASQGAGSGSLATASNSTSSANATGTATAGGSSAGSVGVSSSPVAASASTPTGASTRFLTNPSSAQNPYYGSVTMGTATPDTLKLSLDEVIQRGIAANLAITEARIQQQQSEARQLESLNELLPSIKAEGSTGAHQYNLATLGFNASVISKISGLFPNLNTANFSPIVKVDVTEADAALDWTVLDYAAITRYRAAKETSRAAFYNTQSSRGLVVLNVGNQYLKTLADQSQIESAQSLLRADETLLKQAQAEHEAGTAARLDELRARVQFQTQQQQVIAVENAYDKDLILLKRMIGVPVEQTIQLTDLAPYADLEQMSIEAARQLAYKSRQDYQGMQRQLRAAQLTRSAARYERLPTLTANGNYGVTGVTHGLYHGTFVATGQLKLPIFKEAQFRGDAEVAQAQQNETANRMADLKQQIDQQLRDSMLDLNSAQTLVQVSQQNVDLATRVLSDANDRFAAGVEDNLPVVQAQATLSQAQSQLISDKLQYNQAKLGLARNLGIVDTQYQLYLHGK